MLFFLVKNSENPSYERVFVRIVVEAAGIEPASETVSTGASPGAVHALTFPPLHAHEQACSFSSFICHARFKALPCHVHHC